MNRHSRQPWYSCPGQRQPLRLLCVFVWTLAMVVSTGCAINPVTGWPQLVLVSEEQEKKLGAAQARIVRRRIGLLADDGLTAYLNDLGQRLVAESPRKTIPYQFHVADTEEPNASALPGGYIYVSRGLLALTNSEDELAGVVGHEIGHVAARHGVREITVEGPFAAVIGIVAGTTGLISPLVGSIIGRIGEFLKSVLFSPFERSQEYEADRVGQEIAARAGWDPAAFSTFLRTLERDEALHHPPGRWPSFFNSHPRTRDRIIETAEYAKTLTRATRHPIIATREAFLACLDGIVVGRRAIYGIIRQHAFLHPALNIRVQFPSQWDLERTPGQIAVAAPDGDAAMLLRVLATGEDPMQEAVRLQEQTNVDIVTQTHRTTVGTFPAAQLHLQVDGRAQLEVTWIAYRGLIYQFVSLARTTRFEAYKPVFEAVIQSFRALTEAERTGMTELRLRIVKARAGETIEALAIRTESAWTAEDIAVANAVAMTDALTEGQLMKIARAEPYVSRTRTVIRPGTDQTPPVIEVEELPTPARSEETPGIPAVRCPRG
jgi:predicted Zn-dependent protease